jgi:cardiolipin synthase
MRTDIARRPDRPQPLGLHARAAAAHARRMREAVRAAVRRAVVKRVLWAVVALPVAIVLAQTWHRLVDVYESRPVRTVVPQEPQGAIPAAGTPAFLSAMSALTGTPIVPGHHSELLFDGASTLAGIERDIRAARHSVTIQTYYCMPGRVTEGLKTLLTQRAREGIAVWFLPDGFGCKDLGSTYLDTLRAAGVRVATMRPVHWFSLHRSLHRSHVRSVVIDGRIGYTGGFGFADKWIPSEEGPAWQETTARFTGPAVLQLAGAFAIAWADATGEALTGDRVYPPPTIPDTGTVAGLMYTTRSFGTPVPERFLALSFAAARRTVYLANPYFIPNTDLRRWMKDAASRGVDVRVLTASNNIDHEFTRWAARSTYRELLEAGVRIYEYTPSMLHAKTMSVDGVFGSVGSLNLDNLSLRINDEATFVTQDSVAVGLLERQFLADIARAEEITLERFARRPLWEKATAWLAVLVRDYL